MAEIGIVCVCVHVYSSRYIVPPGVLIHDYILRRAIESGCTRLLSELKPHLLSSVVEPNSEQRYGWWGGNYLGTEWWKQMSTIQSLDALVLPWWIVAGVWSHSGERQLHIHGHGREKAALLCRGTHYSSYVITLAISEDFYFKGNGNAFLSGRTFWASHSMSQWPI